MRPLLIATAVLMLVAAVPQPAAASASFGTACRVEALPSTQCVEVFITNSGATCVDDGGYAHCFVTYTIRLSVPAGICGGASFGIFLTMSTCATGAPATSSEDVRITKSDDAGLPLMPAVEASACAYTPDAPPHRLDCTHWRHPPVVVTPSLL